MCKGHHGGAPAGQSISGVGAGVGSMLDGAVAGDSIDFANAGTTGLVGAGASGLSSAIGADVSASPCGGVPVLSQNGVDTLA